MSENNTLNNDGSNAAAGSPESVINNGKLEQAITNLSESNTQINTQRAVQLLINAKVVVPFNISDEKNAVKTEEKADGSGEVVINSGAEINLVLLTNDERETYCPVFTSKEESDKMTIPSSGMFIQPFTALAKAVTATDTGIKGIVINPFGMAMTLSADLLKNIIRKAEEQTRNRNYTLKAGEKVVITEADESSKTLKDIITAVVRNHKCIERAFLRKMIRPEAPKENNSSYLIILDSSDKDEDITHLFRDLSKLCTPHVKDMPLDFLRYDESNRFVTEAVKDAKPFYRKKIFGLF